MKIQYLIIFLLFSLSACGFHLRGSEQKTKAQVTQVYVSNVDASQTARAVKAQLASGGKEVAGSAAKAKFILKLENERFNQRVLSVSPDTGKVEEYEVTLSVYMTLIDSKGKERILGEEIRLVRDYTFNESVVLGKFAEEELLQKELITQAASQIVRRLNTESASE